MDLPVSLMDLPMSPNLFCKSVVAEVIPSISKANARTSLRKLVTSTTEPPNKTLKKSAWPPSINELTLVNQAATFFLHLNLKL